MTTGSDVPTIRAACTDDIPAVLELWSLARSVHAQTPDRAVDLEQLLADDPGSLLVAEARHRIVGVLIAAWDGWRGNIYRLAVHPDHRRRGLGMALVRAGEDHLRRRGARRVSALVAHEDGVAGSLWDAAGYPLDRDIGRRVRDLP
jgi:ribosomal protein S18 acetylase RimI-like enzyme